MQPPEVVLIVAATRSMGIGANGSMPWTGLRKEMQYFARVTSRTPPHSSPPDCLNAVIMGRKTWDSIPLAFRPLKNRVNIVVSRRASASDVAQSGSASTSTTASASTSNPAHPSTSASTSTPPSPIWQPSYAQAIAYATRHHARVFIIGGAQIYAAALAHPSPAPTRILLTAIQRDFDCDTFFPLALGTPDAAARGWVRASRADLEAWTGQTVAEEGHVEADTRYEFQMWERKEVQE